MITLHTFGPNFGLPDPSPFVTKADVLLKMSGLPYTTVRSDVRRAPKRKLPYIEDDGKIVADSTFIRLHLETNHRVDFDRHLTSGEKDIAWAVEKMLEDHLYWAVVHFRWMKDANFSKGPRRFFDAVPAPMRPLIVGAVRRSVRRNLYGQGTGRHSDAEIAILANRAVDALAGILDDKPYLMGAEKCAADATAFAFTLSALCPLFDSPIRAHAERRGNLVAYGERLRKEFYSVQ